MNGHPASAAAGSVTSRRSRVAAVSESEASICSPARAEEAVTTFREGRPRAKGVSITDGNETVYVYGTSIESQLGRRVIASVTPKA
jgi:hypothetical protein